LQFSIFVGADKTGKPQPDASSAPSRVMGSRDKATREERVTSRGDAVAGKAVQLA